MKGYINNILQNSYGLEYGFITGDNGDSYYFDSRFLEGARTMSECGIDDEVEFSPQPRNTYNRYKAAKDIIFPNSVNKNSSLNGDSISSYDHKELPSASETNPQDQAETSNEIIKYFSKGFAPHLDKKRAYEQYLKKDSGEDKIIEKLAQILYISKIGHHYFDQSSRYQFCLAGATKHFKQYIRGKYEFLVIFSHFDSADWQQKTLMVEREIRKRREIVDRRPLVNFYILISNANNLKTETDKTKGGTNSAIIPFSFKEIIECETSMELSALIITRFGEYLFENNMLGQTDNAIEDDSLLFGDRGKIADSIVHRCQQVSNSGIFGLRRSGKTSVLNAVMRRLEREGIKYINVQSRSDLENLDSWKTALFDLSKKIRQSTLSIEPSPSEDRSAFTKRLNLNSTEEDYNKRPSQYFVEDVKLYCKDEPVFVITIDEVELITYNTAKTSTWKNVEAYCGFWGALRDCGCSLVVSGVNSTINEINNISFNGVQGDNPMYGRIINCADFSYTYLPVFIDEQTKTMINVLGGYSNIAFSNVYSEINRSFGGQPFAIRKFCSFVFGRIKDLRKPNEVYEISKATIDNLLVEFGISADGYSLCEIILQHLTIFKDEYEMLKKLALSPDKYRTIQEKDISKIDHLQKYGLIEYDHTTQYVTFKIHLIKDYICRNSIKDPMDMTNEERRQYIQNCVAECEIKFKTYIRNHYTYLGTESKCRNLLKGYINRNGAYKPFMINKKATPSPNPDTCAFKDFFDHKKFIMYFSSIKTLICDDWGTFKNEFLSAGISKNKLCACLDDLNAGRTDADHYDAEDTTICPDGWDIDNTIMQNFIAALSTHNKFFEKYNL